MVTMVDVTFNLSRAHIYRFRILPELKGIVSIIYGTIKFYLSFGQGSCICRDDGSLMGKGNDP